jgi:DNA-binding MarR family transcriptional regulator
MRLVELLLELSAKWRRWEEGFAHLHQLTPGMVWVLLRLGTTESLCAKELASRIDLSLSRASRLIEQMVVSGLLARDCDPDDRRRCTLRLTKKGSETRGRLNQELDRIQGLLEAEGHGCDWGRMVVLLDKLKAETSSSLEG